MDHTLRPIKESEIPHILEKAALFGGKIIQSNPSLMIETIIKRVDVDSHGTMTIKLTDEPFFERKRPISINFNYRGLVFYLDSTQYAVRGDTIIADFPRGAKAIAIRLDDRYVMSHKSGTMCSIQRIEKRLEVCPLEVQLVDVSQNGLGLLVSECGDRPLLANDHLWIKSLGGMTLPRPIFGRVVYTIVKRYKDNSVDLRVGVFLDDSIPEEIFLELQKRSHLVLSA